MEVPKERGRHRLKVESDIIRRREKEFLRQQMWNGAEKYYKHWEKNNSKFDAWTSPRYYEENNKLMTEIKTKRDKEETLEKRREKLRKLLEEEERTYEIELMVHRNRSIASKPSTSKIDDIPTEVLKDVNLGLKQVEDEKKRREAELKLYHQWRINNPFVRQFESKYRCKDLKLSWLDQQIEKRMQKEKEEQETKKMIQGREERLKLEKEKEERTKRETEEKRRTLKESLDQQIKELKNKQKECEELKKKEQKELNLKQELEELEEKQALEEKRRLDRECALYNIRQHKLKLRQKSADIQENLLCEKELIARLKKFDLQNIIEDEIKRIEIREGLVEFLNIVKEQQELEKQRQKHLEFIFDSEAKAIYERQVEVWRQEELARQRLVKDVTDTLKNQIEDIIEKNREKQRQILREREEMAERIEAYDREMQSLAEKEEKRKVERKNMLDEDIRLKQARKKMQENLKLQEIDEELEQVRKEEERLKKEILAIQRKQGPIRPSRSRLFF